MLQTDAGEEQAKAHEVHDMRLYCVDFGLVCGSDTGFGGCERGVVVKHDEPEAGTRHEIGDGGNNANKVIAARQDGKLVLKLNFTDGVQHTRLWYLDWRPLWLYVYGVFGVNEVLSVLGLAVENKIDLEHVHSEQQLN